MLQSYIQNWLSGDDFITLARHLHDSPMTTLRPLLITGTLLIGASPALCAEETSELHPSLTQRFSLDAGMFFPDRRFTLGADGSLGDNERFIDFEEELHLKGRDQTFAVDFRWRFSENWFLFGQHFRSTEDNGATLENDIPWKDLTFPAGSDVLAGAQFDVMGLTVGRKLETTERHEFGLDGGFHLIDISAYVEGTTVDVGGASEVRRESASTNGPLPIGAWYKYSISPNWAFESRFDWIEASVGKYDGHMIDISAGVNYRLGKNVGVGLDYHRFELSVRVNEENWRGRVYTSYEGFFVYLSAYW